MTKLEKITKIKEFLDEAQVFYFVTLDGDKPRARPISFNMIENGELYFGVGTFKEVYEQLHKNNNLEIVANTPKKWLRLDCKAVFDNDKSLVDRCFEIMPGIAKLYKENNWDMGIFHLENVHAEIKQVIHLEETIEW